ncbi:MAG: hypothetical protein BWK78_01360 [Thiotrichaceae bacterium IS1]|nr:MAG: hypothetical protein BWK78_01360 [Thiotrichaceae bacterium IS1]
MVKFEHGYRIAYDDLTDTLYLSVGNPQAATDSYLDDNYILVRESNGNVKGITIDGFKDRHEDGSWTDTLILKYLPNFNLSSLFGLCMKDSLTPCSDDPLAATDN